MDNNSCPQRNNNYTKTHNSTDLAANFGKEMHSDMMVDSGQEFD